MCSKIIKKLQFFVHLVRIFCTFGFSDYRNSYFVKVHVCVCERVNFGKVLFHCSIVPRYYPWSVKRLSCCRLSGYTFVGYAVIPLSVKRLYLCRLSGYPWSVMRLSLFGYAVILLSVKLLEFLRSSCGVPSVGEGG